MLAPDRVTTPTVVLLRAPAPASTVLTVPDRTPNEALVSAPPPTVSSMVPPDRVRAPVVWLVPPRSRVPVTDKVLAVLPSVPDPVRSSVPALIVVAPT